MSPGPYALQTDTETSRSFPRIKDSPGPDQDWRQPMDAVRKTVSIAILLAVVLCVAMPRLHAEDLDRCQRRVAHAEHELHDAIEKHGRNSKRANHERRELHNVRERCWHERHRWWDEHEHRWHTERDWNEHDHD